MLVTCFWHNLASSSCSLKILLGVAVGRSRVWIRPCQCKLVGMRDLWPTYVWWLRQFPEPFVERKHIVEAHEPSILATCKVRYTWVLRVFKWYLQCIVDVPFAVWVLQTHLTKQSSWKKWEGWIRQNPRICYVNARGCMPKAAWAKLIEAACHYILDCRDVSLYWHQSHCSLPPMTK